MSPLGKIIREPFTWFFAVLFASILGAAGTCHSIPIPTGPP